MLADKDIRFEAAKDHLYFTEKGFHVGLTFPGSAAIDAAMRGGDSAEVLSGLSGLSPLTGTLARLSQSENGLAAGAAALYVGVGGLNGIQGGLDQMLKNAAGSLTPQLSLSSFGISFSSWKSEQRWSESQVSELSAGGDIVLKAGLDAVIGEGTRIIAGSDVSISAGRDILITALADYADSKSKSFGLSIQPFALSVSGSYAATEGKGIRYSNARVEAGGTVSLDAGRDIGIVGGVVAGETAKVTAGRDLSIASVQDTSTYRGTSFGASIGLTPAGTPTGSFNYGSTSGNYANVYEQSGIVAGKGGYQVDVGGNVDLKAGLIVSSADPGLNRLEATSLTFSDLINVSRAETSSYGVSFTPGKLPSPSVGMPAEEESKGTARSTVSPGTLVLSGQKQDLAALNRDADKANTRVEIYDIEALQQKQQDAAIISQALNMAVGDIAQQAGFEEGSPEKVALHAAAGAVTALVSGGDIGVGALSGALSEVANALLIETLKQNPNLSDDQKQAILQWGAALVGAAVGGGQGAATALDNVNYNYLSHADNEKRREAKAACADGDQTSCEVVKELDAKDERQQQEYVACRATGFSGAGCGQVLADVAAALSSYSGIAPAYLGHDEWVKIVGDPDTLREIVEILSPEGIDRLSKAEEKLLVGTIKILTQDPTGATGLPALIDAAISGNPAAILQAVAIFTKVKGVGKLDEIVAKGEYTSADNAIPADWRPLAGVGAQVNTPKGFKSYITPDGDIVHVSPGGLQYGSDPKFGNRIDHVLDHTAQNPSKPVHSVFNVQGDDAMALVDEAWGRRTGVGTLQANGNRTWTVDLGRPVGTNGQTSVQIVVRDGTSEIITAFPK